MLDKKEWGRKNTDSLVVEVVDGSTEDRVKGQHDKRRHTGRGIPENYH